MIGDPNAGRAGSPNDGEVPAATDEIPPSIEEIGPSAAPTPGRAGRVLGAVRVNYVYQAVVLIAGLWLTPFLVRHLGENDYGLWIAGTQIVTWLYVMDLGVVA